MTKFTPACSPCCVHLRLCTHNVVIVTHKKEDTSSFYTAHIDTTPWHRALPLESLFLYILSSLIKEKKERTKRRMKRGLFITAVFVLWRDIIHHIQFCYDKLQTFFLMLAYCHGLCLKLSHTVLLSICPFAVVAVAAYQKQWYSLKQHNICITVIAMWMCV